jgi:hypothetical protein
MTWVELGEFSLWDVRRKQINADLIKWYFAGMRTIGFALFSNQYKAVQDRQLTFLIWLVRVSFALSFVLMFVFTTFNALQRQ